MSVLISKWTPKIDEILCIFFSWNNMENVNKNIANTQRDRDVFHNWTYSSWKITCLAEFLFQIEHIVWILSDIFDHFFVGKTSFCGFQKLFTSYRIGELPNDLINIVHSNIYLIDGFSTPCLFFPFVCVCMCFSFR